MNLLRLINSAVDQAVRALGDAIFDVQVAQDVPVDAQPGEDYSPTWQMHSGKGFFEKVDVTDYPGSEVQSTDRTMVLLKCAYDVDMHDYVRVDEDVYHVYGVKPDLVGNTRVLQKLLLRTENKAGIPWESLDPSAT